MRVHLVVVQGKPEGKVIPLVVPVFKIGRGETCHLRPNSERVSREHAEFTVHQDGVTVRDLGSRNGTLVNGKAITAAYPLKDRDLVQVGPLLFAVSIEAGSPTNAPLPQRSPLIVTPPPISTNETQTLSWSLTDATAPTGAVLGSETIMIPAFLAVPSPQSSQPILPEDEEDAAYERLPIAEGETAQDIPAFEPEFPVSPSKKVPESERRLSSAAAEILRKMMELGQAEK